MSFVHPFFFKKKLHVLYNMNNMKGISCEEGPLGGSEFRNQLFQVHTSTSLFSHTLTR